LSIYTVRKLSYTPGRPGSFKSVNSLAAARALEPLDVWLPRLDSLRKENDRFQKEVPLTAQEDLFVMKSPYCLNTSPLAPPSFYRRHLE
jgi:hypothetical protein